MERIRRRLSKDSKSSDKLIRVNDTGLPSYRIERRDVKYPRLEFKTGELLAILPKSWEDETFLIERKMDWISRKHREIQKAIERIKSRKKGDGSLLIIGDFFEIHESKSLKIDFGERRIECDLRDRNQLRHLGNTLKKRLLHEVELAAKEYGEKLGVRFKRIFIRKQRTKWASCSSRKNLSFNFWLICLPGSWSDIWSVTRSRTLGGAA